jgi:hypothetical protein
MQAATLLHGRVSGIAIDVAGACQDDAARRRGQPLAGFKQVDRAIDIDAASMRGLRVGQVRRAREAENHFRARRRNRMAYGRSIADVAVLARHAAHIVPALLEQRKDMAGGEARCPGHQHATHGKALRSSTVQ